MSEPEPATLEADSVTDAAGQPRPRLAPFVALGVVVVLVALFWVLASASGDADSTSASPLVGRPAPDVVSTTLDGEPFDLARRKGSWVVLNFFNSTCVPCIREHPELVAFHEAQSGLGVEGAELYTIVNDDSDAAVRGFFEDNGGGWPIVRDDDGAIAVAFGVAKVPETWIVSPSGLVVARFTGEVTAAGLSTTLQQLREAGAA